MAYSTPHTALTYLSAAALRVNHDSVLRCQARSRDWKKHFLKEIRESDICAQLAVFFGPSAHVGAQSPQLDLLDLDIRGPTIKAEVKYLRSRGAWTSIKSGREQGVKKDWNTLLAGSSTNDLFNKKAWVVFWPSTQLFRFPECISLSKSHGKRFSRMDFAPFVPLVEVRTTAAGDSHVLSFAADPPRTSVLSISGGKKVRVDLVGSVRHALWCSIYTRLAPADATALGLPATSNSTFTIDAKALPL